MRVKNVLLIKNYSIVLKLDFWKDCLSGFCFFFVGDNFDRDIKLNFEKQNIFLKSELGDPSSISATTYNYKFQYRHCRA
mgnify:CR=1 FL=1